MAVTHPSAYQLGNPTGAYRAGAGVWVSLILGAGFALLSVRGLFSLITSGTRFDLDGPWLWCLIGFGLSAVLIGIWYYQVSLNINVFEQGFIYAKGGATKVIRWDEIEAIWQQVVRQHVYFIPVATSHVYTIQTSKGEKLKLTNSVGKVAELGALIQQETIKKLLPRAIETYNAGGTLQYGKLSIQQTGISNGKEVVPWSQVKGVQISNGYIVIKKEGKWLTWANVAVAQMPNFFVFLALVNQIVGVKG